MTENFKKFIQIYTSDIKQILFIDTYMKNNYKTIKSFQDFLLFENIISEAKITETDQNLLENIFNKMKQKDISIFSYSYQDILNIASKQSWRYYQYFKNNCNKNIKLLIFSFPINKLDQVIQQQPNMKYLFRNLNDACFGITYNINEELSIVWLNPKQILKLSNPIGKIQHEMIHVWSNFLNIDQYKSFGIHSKQKLLNLQNLNKNQLLFLNNNKILFDNEQHILDIYNYIFGQDGKEFQSQVNDICDTLEEIYKLEKLKNKDIWIEDFIKNCSKNIFNKSCIEILKNLNLLYLENINYSFFYQILKYLIIIGLANEDKKWYLNEALKTHFKEDVKEM